MITVNFRNLAFYLTPPSKRYRSDGSITTRVKWLQYLAKPLSTLMDSFNEYRKETLIAANVTSQTASLEWYLRRKYHPSIRIYHYSDLGVYISNENEIVDCGVDLKPEYADAIDGFVVVPLHGEIVRLEGVSFMVDIPASVNVDAVITDLEIYKIAGKKYNINTV